jgi:hypothetical protein
MQPFTKFETAKRLKFAGLPQPKPAVYQFWYGLILNKNVEPIILLNEGETQELSGTLINLATTTP